VVQGVLKLWCDDNLCVKIMMPEELISDILSNWANIEITLLKIGI